MRISTLILWISLLFLQKGMAQRNFQFHTQAYAGLLEGDEGSAFQAQVINGWQLNQWFAGFGLGYDNYLYKCTPVFLSVSRYLGPGRQHFFLSADVGTNFSLAKNQVVSHYNASDYSMHPGLLWAAGAGYAAAMGKNKRRLLLFNVGYSYKEMREVVATDVVCINPPCPDLFERYNYQSRRWSFKIGWQFW